LVEDVEIDAGAVDALLPGHAHEAESLAALECLADDEIREHLAVLALDGDAASAPLERLRARVERIDHAARLVVGGVVGTEVILGDADQARRGLGEAVLAVGGITVVRRNRPASAFERHLERNRGAGRLVKVDHFERLRRIRVGEFGKELLALIEECLGHLLARRGCEREPREQQRDAGVIDRSPGLGHLSPPPSRAGGAPPPRPRARASGAA
jgi:hypothetical protein